jgi:oxygen-dependent protoporphyrinogen oxidase
MVAIIGAGFSGLCLAYELEKKGVAYTLLEASAQVGGYIQSRKIDTAAGPVVVEIGPNSLLLNTEIEQLIEALGLSSEVINASGQSKHRFIVKSGKPRAVPSNPMALLMGSFLSSSAKWAIVKEFTKKPEATNPKESLHAFVTRRFNQELADYLLEPIISGIYAGNSKELLASITFPQLQKMEQEYGSVLKGFIKNPPKRRRTISFTNGLQDLTIALEKKVRCQLNHKVTAINKKESIYSLMIQKPDGTTEKMEADHLILACPAPVAAKLLKDVQPNIALVVQNVYYTSMAAVHSLYANEQIIGNSQGFGFLVPPVEKGFMAGTIFSSSVFSGRAPQGYTLLTTFVGGAHHPDRAKLPEAELQSKVSDELCAFGICKGVPVWQQSVCWTEALPQYNAAVLALQELDAYWENENVYICSNWLGGISLPDLYLKAQKIAERLSP